MPKEEALLSPQMEKFNLDLVILKDRAGKLGLFKTMHKLDDAQKAAGFEEADLIIKKRKQIRESARNV